MKYPKAILGSIALFVLLDILISVVISDRVMNAIFVVVASLVFVGIPLAFRWSQLAQPQRIGGALIQSL